MILCSLEDVIHEEKKLYLVFEFLVGAWGLTLGS